MNLSICNIRDLCATLLAAATLVTGPGCVPMGGSVTFNRPVEEESKKARDLPSIDESSSESTKDRAETGINGALPVKVTKNPDGSFSAGIVSSGSALSVVAPNGTALGGSGLVVNPDSLASPTVISITEGSTLATADNAAKLGVSGLTGASLTMVISSSANEDPKAPLTGSLAISALASLQNSDDEVAVIYHVVVYGQNKKSLLGMIPAGLVSIEDGKAQFSAPFFGAFQAVRLPKGVSKSAEIPSSAPVTTATGANIATTPPGGSSSGATSGAGSGPDTLAPTTSGAITISSLGEFEVGVNVPSASDNVTNAEKLRYRPYYSTIPGLDSVAQVESATPAGDFRPFEIFFRINGLSLHTNYYFNIIVMDEAGNKSVYSSKSFVLPSPPVITAVVPFQSPVSGNVFQKHDVSTTYSVTATDANPGDVLTYSWNLNGIANPAMTASGPSATFSPDMSFLGRHVLTVLVSDGIKSATFSWNIDVHGFSEACVNLAPGQICTLVGSPDVGHGSYPASAPTPAPVTPEKVIDDGNGNLFFTDGELESVWFFNRSAGAMTILGTNVAAGQMKIVAGVGTASYGSEGNTALDFGFQYPKGLAWDSTRGILYVADYSTHKVIRFLPTGVGNVIFGNGSTSNTMSSHVDGNQGTTHSCSGPSSLTLDPVADALYIACTNSNAIKKAQPASAEDLTTVRGYVVVGGLSSGTTSSTYFEGTLGSAGAAKVTTVTTVKLGQDGVLYFTENSTSPVNCRVRAANISGSSKTYFGSTTITTNSSNKLINSSGTCTVFSGGTLASTTLKDPYDLSLVFSGGSVFAGMYIVDKSGHRIYFANGTGGNVEIGGASIAPNEVRPVFGTGFVGYNGDSLSGISTQLNYPLSAVVVNNQLIVGDASNARMRTLNVDVSSGVVGTILGSGEGIAGLSLDTITTALNTRLSSPYAIDISGHTLYITDNQNFRVKSLHLVHGFSKNIAGTGTFGDGSNGDLATLTSFRKLKSIRVINDIVTVADNFDSMGLNRICKIRGINLSNQSRILGSFSIAPNSIGDIAGFFDTGCTTWGGSDLNAVATSLSFASPVDLTPIGSGEIVVVDNLDHCLKKIDANGMLSRSAGICSTTAPSYKDGDLSNSGTAAKFLNPNSIAEDPLHPGNMFITDSTASFSGKIRYLNATTSSITVLGVNIGPNSVGSILTVSGYFLRGIAAFGNQLCFSMGDYVTNQASYSHQVECADRTQLSWTASLHVGSASGKAGRSVDPSLSEGVPAANARLAGPTRITFDDDGNLYIVETLSHQIRKVRKWY